MTERKVVPDMERPSRTKVISFLSGKGGTGKTSIVTNLGVYLAQHGKKVLLVDMDFFTRGLTFYVTMGKKSFDQMLIEVGEKRIENELKFIPHSVISILEGRDIENIQPIAIREGLFLLPPSENSLDLKSSFEIEGLFQKQKNHFFEALLRLKDEFDLILVDQRSGIDPLTLSSALFSDGYVIVTEEDKTSQRASHLLMEALDYYKVATSKENKGCVSLGFVINMYTTDYGQDLIRFMETSVFGERCLAAIPHFSTVRKTFVRDEIMIEKFPRHDFSREISAMSEALLSHGSSLPFKRALSRRRRKLLIPMTTLAMATYVYFVIYIMFRNTDVLDLFSLVLPILPFAFLVVWLYMRRD